MQSASAVRQPRAAGRLGRHELRGAAVQRLDGGPDSPVTPLNQVGTGNDNIFYTGNPGELFNEATGLGVPDLAKFAADLRR